MNFAQVIKMMLEFSKGETVFVEDDFYKFYTKDIDGKKICSVNNNMIIDMRKAGMIISSQRGKYQTRKYTECKITKKGLSLLK